METPKERFGDGLRRLINEQGFKYGAAADRIGVSLSYLNKLMSGEKNPSLETIRMIFEVFGSRAQILFGDAAPEIDGDAAKLISIFKRLPPSFRTILLQVAESLAAQTEVQPVQKQKSR